MPSVAHNTDSKASKSPFEQVRVEEERQQRRVEHERAVLENDTLEQLRKIDAKKIAAEEALRNTAHEELKAFAGNEPIAILQKAKEAAANDVHAVEQIFAKTSKHVIGSLVKQTLDVSILTA